MSRCGTDHGNWTGPCSPERHRFICLGPEPRKSKTTKLEESFWDRLFRFLTWTIDGRCKCCNSLMPSPLDIHDLPA